MNKRSILVVVVLVAFWSIVLAQQPAGPPQPGPEEKRLDYYVGKWHSEADMKPSAFGPGGKVTGHQSCEWFAGGFHVVCHGDFSVGAMGQEKVLIIFSYNREEKGYVQYRIDNSGQTGTVKGTVQGDTWTWRGESKMKGKVVHWRGTYKEVPPDTATMQFEMQGDDGQWNAVMEEKFSRVK
jgi:hypothetical protein